MIRCAPLYAVHNCVHFYTTSRVHVHRTRVAAAVRQRGRGTDTLAPSRVRGSAALLDRSRARAERTVCKTLGRPRYIYTAAVRETFMERNAGGRLPGIEGPPSRRIARALLGLFCRATAGQREVHDLLACTHGVVVSACSRHDRRPRMLRARPEYFRFHFSTSRQNYLNAA